MNKMTLREKIEALPGFDLVRIWLSAGSSELQIGARADGAYLDREAVLRLVIEAEEETAQLASKK